MVYFIFLFKVAPGVFIFTGLYNVPSLVCVKSYVTVQALSRYTGLVLMIIFCLVHFKVLIFTETTIK